MNIGIDLGGSHIAIGVINSKGIIEEKIEKRIMAKEKQNIKNTIEEYIIKNVKEFMKKYEISKIGIAIPGTVNETTIIKSVNLNIENYNIVEGLQKSLKVPISIRNDAKCAAIAENKYGCLKKYNRSLFLTLGTGIGGAVIINNQLLDTGSLPGCEIGHMIIEKNGRQCKCGKKGCFERYSSMKVLKDSIRNELGLDEKTRGQEIFDIIRNNKPENLNYEKIEKIVNEFIENLAIGISNLVNIFEPEAIGIGGSFVYFEEVLLNRLKTKILEGNLLFNERNSINIETAILGNESGIIGSVV